MSLKDTPATSSDKTPVILSRTDLLALRRQYLLSEVADKVIAQRFGLRDHQELKRIATNYGWVELRERIWQKHQLVVDNQVDEQLARLNQANDAFTESIRIQAEEMAEKGFQIARDATEAKEFEQGMRGTKTSVELYRQAAGMDATEGGGNGAPTLAVFNNNFGPIGPAQPVAPHVDRPSSQDVDRGSPTEPIEVEAEIVEDEPESAEDLF